MKNLKLFLFIPVSLFWISGCRYDSKDPEPSTVLPKTEQAQVMAIGYGSDPGNQYAIYSIRLLTSKRLLTIEDVKTKWKVNQKLTVSIP